MSDFRKTYPVCKENFPDLIGFMAHIRKNHRDVPPNKILEMGKEQKWSFRS